MRKLATIRMVRDIQPIKDADNIELLSIDGWKVVSKKGEHQIGDYAIYLEVDSIPYISSLSKLIPNSQDILKFAEGKSKLEDVEREGLVFKSESGQVSFKAISNKWLLREK